jgi:ATP-binding cassette subfamily B protein/subfamily B ATP-binding cassette protein MsbA
MRYRARFTAGVAVSFVVALLNGLSLTAFVPLFDALGDKGAVFNIQITENERKIIQRALNNFTDLEFGLRGRIVVSPAPGRIVRADSADILHMIRKKSRYGLSRLDDLHLKTVIRWKLKINASGYSPLKIVYTACLVILPLYLLKMILHLISVRLIVGTGYSAVRDIRRKLYLKAQRLPLTYFYREKTGLLMSRLINDVEIVAAVISSNLRDSITNFFYILTHVFILAYLNVYLLIISFVTVPLILSPVTFFAKKIRKSTTLSQEFLAELNAHLQEAIGGVRVIRSFGMESYETERFRHVNQKLYWRTFKQEFYLRLGPNLVELSSVMVTLGIISLGAYFLDPVNFTGGEFIAFLFTLLFILRPIMQLSGMYGKIIQSITAGNRIFEIMDMEVETEDPRVPVEPSSLHHSIVFENVSFVYPGTDREVLHDINLVVPAGKTVAIVGESGSGKSTLMDLMARFFIPTEGRILIDGHDIQDYRVRDHRSRIGIVTQEIFLFYGTVRENIAYGRPEFADEEIIGAARLAHAHEFIAQMPDGYDTITGSGGFNLSGGQRQRLAISRALLRNPEILILDEATSALDTESERLVQEALERLFQNRTTFVIAHRLSTIEKADIIVVISGGRIVDMGTHEDLISRQGLYARLQEISRSSAPGDTE